VILKIHLSFNYFDAAIMGGCRVVVHGVWIFLDIHPNQMVL
jgi:hypothetical protein